VEGDRGVRLRVRDVPGPSKDAPTLVLHHGLASSQRIWDLTLPTLSRRHRVITYDARGHGLSGKPSAGYGFDSVVADARAVLRSTRARRPVFVGHSWGAMTALQLAAEHPSSVAGTVLVDGGVARMRSQFPSWKDAKMALAPPRLAGMTRSEFRGLIRTFFADAVDVTPDVEDIVMSVMRVDGEGRIRPRLSRANHFRILHAIWNQDPIVLHASLQVPTLAIMAHRSGDDGERDWEDAKHEAELEIRRAGALTRFAWLEGIHDLPLQHPDGLARLIQTFARTAVG
jgi:pimeloyl-ACP methyl ester carboxylesterase